MIILLILGMKKPDMKIVKELAENLDCGYDCYYIPSSNEIITISNDMKDLDEELYQETYALDLEKIKQTEEDVIKIEPLGSFESYRIMEDYCNKVPDIVLKQKLQNALSNRKPFQNFKLLIDNSNYKKDWFDFKQKAIQHIVEKILASHQSKI
ncbi:UPF0158 family protein [Hyunsoonleella sp. 2307UL5-6]|uniref:UPF0158 family protein n=1 Tax=Hyunsoonleella sp. 2307UL5-6 TaxID=3384768 RepID=UPI0039BC4C30